MENTNSKILSFDEWVANKENGEMPGEETQTAELPAPAEEPVSTEEPSNLSVNMMDSEPAEIEPSVEVEDKPEEDSKESDTEAKA